MPMNMKLQIIYSWDYGERLRHPRFVRIAFSKNEYERMKILVEMISETVFSISFFLNSLILMNILTRILICKKWPWRTYQFNIPWIIKIYCSSSSCANSSVFIAFFYFNNRKYFNTSFTYSIPYFIFHLPF